MIVYSDSGKDAGRMAAAWPQPPAMINGRLRVTVQGEVIEQNFGEHENCFHTLDLYTAATLEHSLSPPTAPSDEW